MHNPACLHSSLHRAWHACLHLIRMLHPVYPTRRNDYDMRPSATVGLVQRSQLALTEAKQPQLY